MTTATTATAGYDDALRILQAELSRASTLLSELVQPGASALGNALPHLVSSGGKMIRPLLTLASGYAAGGVRGTGLTDPCVRAAAAVEMLHAGTLCHDDVMDEADTRRGVSSVNAKWGNCRAILCGDVLIARALKAVSELGPAETRVLTQTLEDLCEGQAMETATLFDLTRSRAAYLRTVELKTASLFAACCQLGAMAAGLDLARAERFGVFGRAVGMAFQVVDDVLDLVGSKELLGKPAGSDLRAGVLTLPVIDALDRVPELRELLADGVWAARAEPTRAIVVSCGALDAALDEVRGYLGQARNALHQVPGVDVGSVAALIGLAESVLERGIYSADTTMTDRLMNVLRPWAARTEVNPDADGLPLAEQPPGGPAAQAGSAA